MASVSGVIAEAVPGVGTVTVVDLRKRSPEARNPMYAITLHQPWASLITLGLKTVETRSWPAPAKLVGQRIAIHAGKRLVRQPSEAIERELRARWGEHWPVNMPTGAVVATAVLAGIARVARADLPEGCAVHDPEAEVGCAAGRGRTTIDHWGDFSSGRWLWFLDDVEGLPEPVPAVGWQSLWRWDAGDQRW